MRSDATIGPGFSDPPTQTQAIFRGVLAAMSAPGQLVALSPAIEAPAPLMAPTAALLLTLADFQTPVWLDAGAANDAVAGYLRFHSGCPITAQPSAAAFAVVSDAATILDPEQFGLGSDDYPDRSTTLFIQLESLGAGVGLRLSGPGIDGTTDLAVAGLSVDWLGKRQDLASLFPAGLDMILISETAVAALPRSTNIEIRQCMSP